MDYTVDKNCCPEKIDYFLKNKCGYITKQYENSENPHTKVFLMLSLK